LAAEYGFTDLDGSQPDAFRYMVDAERAGAELDLSKYR
jgi:hypothetical protein